MSDPKSDSPAVPGFSNRVVAFLIAILCLFVASTATLAAPAPPPTRADVSYGPHERNKFDLWQAKSDKPTPLVIFIHGGGFVNGDKQQIRNSGVVQQCLDAGVSFASLNYRFREHAPIQDILRDAARAVQTLRHRSPEWNLDPQRIASFGGSAGAGTSLWLAFHDDLADPQATDPVLRESSRLAAAGSLNGQASYDLRDWEKILGAASFSRPKSQWLAFYGFDNEEEADSPAADKIMRDCGMVGLVTKDDPPVICACLFPNTDPQERGHYVHHPKHALAIAAACQSAGIDCKLLLADDDAPANERAARADQQKAVVTFLIEKLKQ